MDLTVICKGCNCICDTQFFRLPCGHRMGKTCLELCQNENKPCPGEFLKCPMLHDPSLAKEIIEDRRVNALLREQKHVVNIRENQDDSTQPCNVLKGREDILGKDVITERSEYDDTLSTDDQLENLLTKLIEKTKSNKDKEMEIDELQKQNTLLQQQIDAFTEQMNQLEELLQQLDEKEAQQKEIKQWLQIFENHCQTRKDVISTITNQAERIVKLELLNEHLKKTLEGIKKIEVQKNNNDIELVELEKRLCNLFVCNKNGRLIWKVNEYSKKKASQNHSELNFSLGECGYSMMCKLRFLQKGVQLSVCIKKGDYDEILPWPLCVVVEITLKDLETMSEDITQSFPAEFDKPQQEGLIEWKQNAFYLHYEDIKSPFLKSDEIYLEVQVN